MANMTGLLLAKIFELTKQKAEFTKLAEETGSLLETSKKELIAELKLEGTNRLGVDGIGQASTKPRLFISVPEYRAELAIKWFKEHEEYKNCVKEYIHPKTIDSTMNEYFKKNNRIPEWADYYAASILSLSKEAKK